MRLAPDIVRARAERDSVVTPTAELRALRATMYGREREGQRVYHAGTFWVYAHGDWWKQRPEQKQVDPAVIAHAVEMSNRLQEKYDAAPSYQDLIDIFGEQGVVRDASGKIMGYNYPQPKDDEQRRKLNAAVYELWARHHQIAEDIGLEESAQHQAVTLMDPRTGRTVSAHPRTAAQRARKAGFVEKRRRLKR